MNSFWQNHVVYMENGKQKLRGRYYLALAFVIWLGGNYFIQVTMPRLMDK
jgi:hypothetical protein